MKYTFTPKIDIKMRAYDILVNTLAMEGVWALFPKIRQQDGTLDTHTKYFFGFIWFKNNVFNVG